MSVPIPVRALTQGIGPVPQTGQIVELPMSAHDRRRVRRLIEAPDGTVLALELPTGTVLMPGQIVYEDASRTVVVAAADEDVLVIEPHDLAEAAHVAHLIGNLHRDIEVTPTEIVALSDRTLAERLARVGVAARPARRPFHGRAPGDHAH